MVLPSTRPGIEETKEGHYDDKAEKIEITALSFGSDSCIDNMPDSVTDSCD
jgi:hypothetical protein